MWNILLLKGGIIDAFHAIHPSILFTFSIWFIRPIHPLCSPCKVKGYGHARWLDSQIDRCLFPQGDRPTLYANPPRRRSNEESTAPPVKIPVLRSDCVRTSLFCKQSTEPCMLYAELTVSNRAQPSACPVPSPRCARKAGQSPFHLIHLSRLLPVNAVAPTNPTLSIVSLGADLLEGRNYLCIFDPPLFRLRILIYSSSIQPARYLSYETKHVWNAGVENMMLEKMKHHVPSNY